MHYNKLDLLQRIIVLMIVFMLGWVLNSTFSTISLEHPTQIITGSAISNNLRDRPSPSDIIKQEDIHVFSDRIIIYVDNPQWAKFTDTKSMDPVFDKEANALQIVPRSKEQINVGDIISFRTEYDSSIIIHRVVEIGYDDEGWFALTKGDNNAYMDRGKRRFEDITKLLFGIIY